MRLEQVKGCLLGQAVADSLGATFEGQETEWLRGRFAGKEQMVEYSAAGFRNYTDDTEMALALASQLACRADIDPQELMQGFVQEYTPWRGYGRGTRVLIEAFGREADYEHLVEHLFPGGSWGNGAAMRAAPIGLRFARNHDLLWEQARLSAWPTHRNILGIEGAQLIAFTTALAVSDLEINPQQLMQTLLPRVTTAVFGKQLSLLGNLTDESELSQFGNGIGAHESVVTAIGCFALHPDSFEDAVALAIWQGGDTDTIAAMTGALVGARLGAEQIPADWSANLEDAAFAARVDQLSGELFAAASR